MYSVVVTSLMSFGATTPDFNWFNNSGCNGCYGSGYSCNGCYGCTGCNGSSGGSGFLGLGLFSRSSYGGCHGCSGYTSCHGCSGCYGSCYGSYSVPMVPNVGMGFAPTYGGTYPAAPPMMPGGSFPAAPLMMPGGTILPPAGLGEQMMPPASLGETTAPPLAVQETTSGSNQVTLVVTLPADARLYAEKQLIPLAGPVRVFVTPALEPGRTYYYDVTMEVDRGGKPIQKTQSVELQVGKVSRVTFPEPN